MEDGTLPLPGTPEARLQGCTCPEHETATELEMEPREKSCPLHGGLAVFGQATPGKTPSEPAS